MLSRLCPFLAAVLVVLLTVMIWSDPAFAKQTRAYTGLSFGPDGAGGGKSFKDVQSVGVDQISGDVFVYDIIEGGAEGRLYKFSSGGVPIDFPASGENSIAVPSGPTEAGAEQVAIAPGTSPGGTAGHIYVANNATVTVYSPTGAELGTVGEGETCGVAVDPEGQLFIGSFGETIREYTPAADPAAYVKTGEGTIAINLCNVAADGAGDVYASSYDGTTTAQLKGIADLGPGLIEPGGATLAADPVTNALYLDQGNRVSALDSSAAPPYEFAGGNVADSYGVAVYSSADRVYVSDGSTGTIKAYGPPLSYPITEPATDVRTEAATLNGTVYPEGRQYTGCRFEYGLVGSTGFEGFGNCEPEASQIDPSTPSQAVSLSLEGLQLNSDYKFRLSVTNSAGTIEGETLTFSTSITPIITEPLARDADQSSATLEATIDPRRVETSYRIEWGPTDSYGNVAAAGAIPSGKGPTQVTGQLAGLAPAANYHYRVIAESAEGGEAASPDQKVQTLNSCGFTDLRCLELVSRTGKGFPAEPGKRGGAAEQIQFQAAAQGSALAYAVLNGYPDATNGYGPIYLGRRATTGWNSEQLSPPTLAPPLQSPYNSNFRALSPDLSCGVVASVAPLAAGAPTGIVEAGGANLYRRDNATGSYQTITYLTPVGPPTWQEVVSKQPFGYQVVGMSSDCRRVVFRTQFRYAGIPSVSLSGYQLYEWDHGALHNVAVVPGPGGTAEPVPAESLPGALDESPSQSLIGSKSPTDYWHATSSDGSRSIFTAVSQFGDDSGTRAIFLREASDPDVAAGTVPATDLSKSETATPNNGNSRYWTASTDGSRIFFTARYGLAANGSSTGATVCANDPKPPFGHEAEGYGDGCDLYEYDVDAPVGERLTDLSADLSDPAGASVVGVLDVSEDGSYVYFAARGRLGGGKDEAENLQSETFNLYVAHAGAISFIRSLGAEAEGLLDGEAGRATVNTGINGAPTWTSRSTSEGTRFAFESTLGVPGNTPMTYLYSAATGTTVCVSCRRDGKVPSPQPLASALIGSQAEGNIKLNRPTVLTESGRLYFYSLDPLAPGAIEGTLNLYQWDEGQVSLIATEPPGALHDESTGERNQAFFAGASAEGDDVYFASPQGLTSAATAGWNVYDARVGGGFPEPNPPTSPCDATAEGACNPGSANPPAPAPPATSAFGGPGNPPNKKKHHKKHHKRKHKHRHHKKRHPKKAPNSRRADHRRAGK